jgi:hypothetical protein
MQAVFLKILFLIVLVHINYIIYVSSPIIYEPNHVQKAQMVQNLYKHLFDLAMIKGCGENEIREFLIIID